MPTGVQEVEPGIWRWRDSQEEVRATWPREEPAEPQTGQGWFDEGTSCIYVWDGDEWVCIPAD
jgi:hypothetical protein